MRPGSCFLGAQTGQWVNGSCKGHPFSVTEHRVDGGRAGGVQGMEPERELSPEKLQGQNPWGLGGLVPKEAWVLLKSHQESKEL